MKHGKLDQLPEQPVSHDPDIKKRVMFTQGEIPSVTQYSQASFLPGQIAPTHSHEDMYEVFLCVRGTGSIVIDGQTYDLNPGHFYLCEPGETHEIVNDGHEALEILQLGVLAERLAQHPL
jgi:quercetin dioxygenase-like cupin family protein